PDEWKKIQDDPAYYQRVVETIQSLKGYRIDQHDIDRALTMLEQKKDAQTYEECKEIRRDALTALHEAQSGEDIIDAIGHMTKEEQERYRTDEDFRATVQAYINPKTMSGREAEAAGRLLTMIEKGASPPEAVVQLVKDAAHFDVDESQVARDLQQAFRDDPTLQARIQNPQTEADKELSQQIKDAASSVGSWD